MTGPDLATGGVFDLGRGPRIGEGECRGVLMPPTSDRQRPDLTIALVADPHRLAALIKQALED